METIRLGILTWRKGPYVEEKTYFTHLAKEAQKWNTEVILFSPNDVLNAGKIRALYYEPGKGWIDKICPPPHVVYDRFRNMQQAAFKQFIRFREQSKWIFLNSRLAHKWNLYRFMQQNQQIQRWLPETLFLENPKDALGLLKKYHSIYLKPVNGTGGKGILSISKQSNGPLQVLGRNNQRKKVKAVFNSIPSLVSFIKNWTGDAKYIAQQGLELEWDHGLVTDFRLLVQKDGSGQWTVTGLGGKIGGKNSATSNLHGGGKAIPPEVFLRRYFPEEKRNLLYEECNKLGLVVAEYLEEKFGRLLELGIDLGIDKEGKVWIIEVNNKPGRDIFKQMGDTDTYLKAVRRPIEYARYIYEGNRDG